MVWIIMYAIKMHNTTGHILWINNKNIRGAQNGLGLKSLLGKDLTHAPGYQHASVTLHWFWAKFHQVGICQDKNQQWLWSGVVFLAWPQVNSINWCTHPCVSHVSFSHGLVILHSICDSTVVYVGPIQTLAQNKVHSTVSSWAYRLVWTWK